MSRCLLCAGGLEDPPPQPPTCPETRNSIFGFDLSSKKSLGQWVMHVELGYLQMDTSADSILLGGSLMCGQKQGQKCMIVLSPQTGAVKNVVLDAEGPELGVLHTASHKDTIILYETFTGDARTQQIVALDWAKDAGEQVVFNSSSLPIPCAQGSYSCETTGFLYVDK